MIWVNYRTFISSTTALIFVLLSGYYIEAASMESGQLNKEDAEKQVTFYHTYGYRKNGEWIIPIRIWVHEKPGLKRRALAKLARLYLVNKAEIDDLSRAEKNLYEQRSEDFIADSKSNQTIVFKFDDDLKNHEYFIEDGDGKSTTDRNGRIEGTLRLDEKTADRLLKAQHSKQGWLSFKVTSDDHWGVGYAKLIQPGGISVISDIDDTIKVTNIPDGENEVLKNTFFRNFVAAPCMAEMYNSFGDDVAFHYVSGGPWQMYAPLDKFLFAESAGFPRGSFHMKNLRTNPFESESYEDFWTIIANGSQAVTFEQKIAQISTLMAHFPERYFILIGDSGEKDPEVFKKIRKDFPAQVQEIRIRVISSNGNDPDRLEKMTRIPANMKTQEVCSEFIKSN